jgi:taurine dioxygenase
MALSTLHRMKVEPLSPLIGAVIDPGPLKGASDAVIEVVRQAIHEHQVVFVRGQHLYDDDLYALAKQLGQPMEQPTAFFRNEPTVASFEITLERPPRADNWHTDLSFYEAPPAYGVLSNMAAPQAGGDTVFSSSYMAYNALSAPLQQVCRMLKLVHSPGEGLLGYARRESGPAAAERIANTHPAREQPLVIRHPHTGRLALYVSGGRAFTEGVAGFKPDESEALLRLLCAPYDNPNHQARWRWTPGDLAIWDQRAVNHRGLSDHFPAFPHRKMQSVFIGDGRPIATLAA